MHRGGPAHGRKHVLALIIGSDRARFICGCVRKTNFRAGEYRAAGISHGSTNGPREFLSCEGKAEKQTERRAER